MWMIDEAWQGKIDSYGGIALPGFPTCSCQLKGHLAPRGRAARHFGCKKVGCD
jgi:hypothetical protein